MSEIKGKTVDPTVFSNSHTTDTKNTDKNTHISTFFLDCKDKKKKNDKTRDKSLHNKKKIMFYERISDTPMPPNKLHIDKVRYWVINIYIYIYTNIQNIYLCICYLEYI